MKEINGGEAFRGDFGTQAVWWSYAAGWMLKASKKDMKCFRECVINSRSYTLLNSINCTEKPPGTHENTSGGGRSTV